MGGEVVPDKAVAAKDQAGEEADGAAQHGAGLDAVHAPVRAPGGGDGAQAA